MPKTKTRSTAKKRAVRASGRRADGAAAGLKRPHSNRRKKKTEYSCVMEEGRISHVLVPIEDYERMIETEMVETAVKRAGEADEVFVDADELALELAGKRIAAARKAAGLTQKQLGARLKIPQSQVSRIEHHPDHTTVRTLKRMAKALGVHVSNLL